MLINHREFIVFWKSSRVVSFYSILSKAPWAYWLQYPSQPKWTWQMLSCRIDGARGKRWNHSHPLRWNSPSFKTTRISTTRLPDSSLIVTSNIRNCSSRIRQSYKEGDRLGVAFLVLPQSAFPSVQRAERIELLSAGHSKTALGQIWQAPFGLQKSSISLRATIIE